MTEVLQDDGDVHVDDHQEGDDQIRHNEHDAHAWDAAVRVHAIGRVALRNAVLSVGEAGEERVPVRARADLKQRDHAVGQRLEVEDVVDATRLLDVI